MHALVITVLGGGQLVPAAIEGDGGFGFASRSAGRRWPFLPSTAIGAIQSH